MVAEKWDLPFEPCVQGPSRSILRRRHSDADPLDEGPFGPTLLFVPFNYAKGRQYGVEFSTSLNRNNLTAYTNFAYSVAQGTDIVSDQYLFAADELETSK